MADAESPWAWVYEPPHNVDPLRWAENGVGYLFGLHREIPAARQQDPAAFSVFGPDISDEAFARRVVAMFLNYGWQPPTAARQLHVAPDASEIG